VSSNYVIISDDAVYRLFYEVTCNVFCHFDKDEQSRAADVILGARIMATTMIQYLEEKGGKDEKVPNPSAD
jgi:hypothetical protein